MRQPLADLRLADIAAFLTVRRSQSISAAARELDVTPSQVSKALARLSRGLGRRIIAPSRHGVALTEEGARLAPHLEETLLRLGQLQRGETAPVPELALAAPSYLLSVFAASIAAALEGVRVRAIALSPAHIRAFATDGLFDVAITVGIERLPKVWVARGAGELRRGLFAAPALAARLGPPPVAVDRIRELPFIAPAYVSEGKIVAADDDCPLHRGERRLGHEVETMALALDLAAQTEQLVFGPAIAARSLCERGLLAEVRVRGWNVAHPLSIACHGDRVRAGVQRAIAAAVRAELAKGTAL